MTSSQRRVSDTRHHPRIRLSITDKRVAPRYHRKARLMDALGVSLLIAFSAAMGCIVLLLSVPR